MWRSLKQQLMIKTCLKEMQGRKSTRQEANKKSFIWGNEAKK